MMDVLCISTSGQGNFAPYSRFIYPQNIYSQLLCRILQSVAMFHFRTGSEQNTRRQVAFVSLLAHNLDGNVPRSETFRGSTRVVCMPSFRLMPDGPNGVLNGDHLVLESPSPPRFDGESWAITGPTWKGFDHIRYIFIL